MTEGREMKEVSLATNFVPVKLHRTSVRVPRETSWIVKRQYGSGSVSNR